MTAEEQVAEPAGADAPAGGRHEMQVGQTQAFDARGIARTVWVLRCSCGYTGKAIDQSGIGREARLHALEMKLGEVVGMVNGLLLAFSGLAEACQAAGIEPVQADEPPATREECCEGGCDETCPHAEPPNIGDTCCGECAPGRCYVDQVTGA